MEDSERRKAIELLKEMRSESKIIDAKPGNQETHLKWMYKSPSDLVDKEEYLLGKAIDKNFEMLNSGGNSDGRVGEQSNVPKRLLEKTESLEQVDIAKKILEDPLYAIKQKEIEARKKLLNNPVKLKQIKQMLLERSKQNSSHKLKKKKKLNKKKSEQDLNILILKKLEKFTDKEKRKALNKVIKSGFDSDSTESSSSNNRKDKKPKSHKKRSHSSEDDSSSESSNSSSDSSSDSSSGSSSSSSSSSSEKFSKKKRKKNKITKKKQNRKSEESVSSSSSSDYERNKNSKTKTSDRKHRKSFNSGSKNSTIINEVSNSKDKSQRNLKNSTIKNRKRDVRENDNENQQSKIMENNSRRRSAEKRSTFSGEESRFKRHYGLTILDDSKPEKKKGEFPVQKYQKSAETKKKYVAPAKVKPLSDKEREEKLKEMMENAKLRKEDREKNLANHRKKQIIEEQSKTYDDDFMRRQMSQLTSRGTMADRIKSNINNIQRSNSSMETNFMLK